MCYIVMFAHLDMFSTFDSLPQVINLSGIPQWIPLSISLLSYLANGNP